MVVAPGQPPLRIGQRVRCEVDMYGRRQEYEGRITGFTMGTGSTLALLHAMEAEAAGRPSRRWWLVGCAILAAWMAFGLTQLEGVIPSQSLTIALQQGNVSLAQRVQSLQAQIAAESISQPVRDKLLVGA